MNSINRINVDLEIKNNDTILLYGVLFGYFLRICDIICDKNKKIIHTNHTYFNMDADRNEILQTNETLTFKNKLLDYMDGTDSYSYDNYFVTLRNCGTSTHSEIIYIKRIPLYYTKNEYLSSVAFNISDYNCEYDKMICKTVDNKTYKYLTWNKIENKNLNKKIKNIDIDLEYDGYKYYFINIKNENISTKINKDKIKINNTISIDYYSIKINNIYITDKDEIVSNKYFNIITSNKNYISYGWLYSGIVIIALLLIYIIYVTIKYINNIKKNNNDNIDNNAIYIELEDL